MNLEMKSVLSALLILVALASNTNGRAIDDMDNSIQTEDNTPLVEQREWVKLTKIPPANVYHEIGGITEIECEAMGTPAPEVQWVPGNMVKEINTISLGSPSTLVKVRSILVIDHLKHAKTFSCIASSAGKPIIATTTVHPKKSAELSPNDVLQLRHEPRKPKIIYNYSLYLETVGSTIVLPCRIAANRHKAEKYWVDSAGNVINGDNNQRIKLANNGDLIITDLKWEDMGAYKCVAENSIGRDYADTFVYPALSDE